MLATTTLLRAYHLMCQAGAMADIYENNRAICKYVHSTSRGHEAIQLATAFQLLPTDYVSPYYRDESLLLGLGFTPYELMLQLLAKADDIFTGGREYYSHPNFKGKDKPTIIHQSSATGMQVIPSTGIAHGIQYFHNIALKLPRKDENYTSPVVVCSLGDASVTEGEVSEAFQFAALKQLPIIYLIQDNDWGISATAAESRTMNVYEYACGFPGIQRVKINGYDFLESYDRMANVINEVRTHRTPYIVQAKVPLLGHHTSGVRKEFYRSSHDLSIQQQNDPVLLLRNQLQERGVEESLLQQIKEEENNNIKYSFDKAVKAPEPAPSTVIDHIFAPTLFTKEKGTRKPSGKNRIMMVDAALLAIKEILEDNPEAIFFGQDVGRRLGGVFREAATLGEKFGDHRVFNTAIQEAYIIGSTVGLSAVGVKPIVEIQFADYIYPGLNQLATEMAKSCYLSCGKFPVQTLIRVPTGSYGGGGPYHSGSIETTLLSIKGIKIVYPSNAADMKGLMKASFYDPNPVVMLEHKGLYWSKMEDTEDARTPEPSRDYLIPLGKANIVLSAAEQQITNATSCCIITYGMGVYWAKAAAAQFKGQIEIIDLRTLYPLDEDLIFTTVKKHGKCIVLTEEQQNNSFAEALAGRISKACFQWLETPVEVMGALNVPAIPMNIRLENAVLPNKEKLALLIQQVLQY